MDITLFPHNQKVYDMVLSYYREVNKVAVVQATGTGKGYLASAFVHKAFKKANVLILTPNNDIKTNYKESLGITSGDRVQLWTYPRLLNLYKTEGFKKVIAWTDLLIVDEFHRLGAEKWGESTVALINALDKKGAKILGLTATPIRYNDMSVMDNPNILEEDKEKLRKARNMADEIFEGNIVQGVSLEEAVYCSILPSFNYILGSYGYDSIIKTASDRLVEMEEDPNLRADNKYLREYKKNLEEIIENYGSENENLRKLIQSEIRGLSGNQKWIIFCSSVDQLKEIDDDISYWFEKPINKFKSGFKYSLTDINLYSVYSGENRNTENEENLTAFYKATEGLHIIKCINKLTEGAHVANITGVIMLRNTLSPIVYLQQIGRALSAGNKNHPIIFDFVGNIDNMTHVANGEDGYVNSIRKSAAGVRAFNRGEAVSSFLSPSEMGYYRKDKIREPRIVIKDKNIVGLSKLFGNLQDILNHRSSLEWSELELNILNKYYVLGGVNAVQHELKKKSITPRSAGAIESKAKSLGLKFNPRDKSIKANKSSILDWNAQEDAMILKAFKYSSKSLSVDDVCMRLSLNELQHRSINQIKNRYEHLRNGRGVREKGYPNSGKSWTPEEIEDLRMMTEYGVSLSYICDKLGRSPKGVLEKGRAEGIYRQERNISSVRSWTREEEDFLFNNHQKMSIKEMATYLNRTQSSVDNKLKRVLNDRLQTKRRDKFNYDVENKNGWSRLELRVLVELWDAPWEEVCEAFPTKTPKQIKLQIKRECKSGNIPEPKQFRENPEYRKIS